MKKNTNQTDKTLVGSHLTVTTYPDGKKDLKWDWDTLVKEVQVATGDRKVYNINVDVENPEKFIDNVKKTLISVSIDEAVKTEATNIGINVEAEVTQALAKEGFTADIVKATETKVRKTRSKKK